MIQYLIFSAVVISNAHWQWTPNGYLAGWIGIAVAFLVTVVAVRVADMLRAHGVARLADLAVFYLTRKPAARPPCYADQ